MNGNCSSLETTQQEDNEKHTYLRCSVGVRALRGVPLGRASGGIVVCLIGSALLVPSCKKQINEH